MSRATVLRWTRFASNPHGTGPEKRSAQVLALCRAAGVDVFDMVPPRRVSTWQTWTGGLAARLRFGPLASIERAGPGLLGFRTAFYRDALRAHAGAKVLLWETTYDSLLPNFAREAGFRIIALPHNLEALASERAFASDQPALGPDLAAEITRLGETDTVFTIAKEEQWLLQAFGLTAEYLPFYPDENLAAEALAIRERRAASHATAAGPLLILGSAFNPATRVGMQRQLEWLSGAAESRGIVVAGPETETFFASYVSPRVRVLGQVTRDRLVELLNSCAALLIHTERGAGAVTRIPEALLSGIPVIANRNAARDQHGTPGVHVYDDRDEFIALALASLPVPPAPPRPLAAEKRFQAALSKLL
jgi:hypothetical protein